MNEPHALDVSELAIILESKIDKIITPIASNDTIDNVDISVVNSVVYLLNNSDNLNFDKFEIIDIASLRDNLMILDTLYDKYEMKSLNKELVQRALEMMQAIIMERKRVHIAIKSKS